MTIERQENLKQKLQRQLTSNNKKKSLGVRQTFGYGGQYAWSQSQFGIPTHVQH